MYIMSKLTMIEKDMTTTQTISLTKKIDDLKASGHNELASLVEQSAISLTKHNIAPDHVAKVVFMLDKSGSMSGRFSNGTVADAAKKALAQGIIFDDDGKIDIFHFGEGAEYIGEYGVDDFDDYINSLQKVARNLDSSTDYHKAIDLIVNHYKGNNDGLPVYVIFLTDGAPSSESAAERSIIAASKSPVFFQFVGVGDSDYFPEEDNSSDEVPLTKPEKKGFFATLLGGSSTTTKPKSKQSVPHSFKFLAKLDELPEREIDNAGFFAIKDFKSFDSKKLYDLFLSEYPNWLKEAKSKRLI